MIALLTTVLLLASAIVCNNGVGGQSSLSLSLEPPYAERGVTDRASTNGRRSMLRQTSPSVGAVKKGSFHNESIPVVRQSVMLAASYTTKNQDDRMLAECGGDDSYFRLDLTTDNYG